MPVGFKINKLTTLLLILLINLKLYLTQVFLSQTNLRDQEILLTPLSNSASRICLYGQLTQASAMLFCLACDHHTQDGPLHAHRDSTPGLQSRSDGQCQALPAHCPSPSDNCGFGKLLQGQLYQYLFTVIYSTK